MGVVFEKATTHPRRKTTHQGLRVRLVKTDPVLLTGVVHLERQGRVNSRRTHTQAYALALYTPPECARPLLLHAV